MGRNQSRDTMMNLAKELDIDWHQARLVSKEIAIKNWKEARKYYFKTKPLHEQWRDEFQQSAIDAIAEEEKIDRDKKIQLTPLSCSQIYRNHKENYGLCLTTSRESGLRF